MEKVTLNVEGMSCPHCVRAVSDAVSELPGVADVSIDLAEKTVKVEFDPTKSTLDNIKAEITDQGYTVA